MFMKYLLRKHNFIFFTQSEFLSNANKLSKFRGIVV